MPKNLLVIGALVLGGVVLVRFLRDPDAYRYKEVLSNEEIARRRAAATTPTGLLDYNERQFQIKNQAPAYVVQDWSYE